MTDDPMIITVVNKKDKSEIIHMSREYLKYFGIVCMQVGMILGLLMGWIFL